MNIDLDAIRPQPLRDLLKLGFVARRQTKMAPLFREAFSRCRTNTLGRAGDECTFTAKIQIHDNSVSRL